MQSNFESQLFNECTEFFSNDKNKNLLKKITTDGPKVSCRFIDDYLKVIGEEKVPEGDKTYRESFLAYKSESNGIFNIYQKNDDNKIPFKVMDVDIETSLNQINFFKWSIENGIIERIIDDYSDFKKERKEKKKLENKDIKKIVKKKDKSFLVQRYINDAGDKLCIF